MAERYVALLRGINVGGKNKLPMKELKAIFLDAGCSDVDTFIQSGNVVFRAPAALAKRLPRAVADAVSGRFGLRVPVVMRSAEELRRAVDANPFVAASLDSDLLHIAFLVDAPKPAQVAALDPNRSPADRFEVRGRDVYLYFPNGVSGSKLTNDYLDSRLGTTSTLRNWRTTLKLLELAESKTD